MRKRWLWWGMALLLVGVLVAVISPISDIVLGKMRGEAFYHGLPSSYWARVWTNSLQAERFERSSFLAGYLGKLLAIMPTGPDLKSLLSGDPAAVSVILEAQPAVIDLLRNHPNSFVRWQAAQTLDLVGRTCGSEVLVLSLEALSEATQDREELIAGGAVRYLGSRHQQSDRVVPALVHVLQQQGSPVREEALRKLVKFGPEARTAVPTLITLLKDPDVSLHWLAVDVLGEIGPDAKVAVPALRELMHRPNDLAYDRRMVPAPDAAKALQKIDPTQVP